MIVFEFSLLVFLPSFQTSFLTYVWKFPIFRSWWKSFIGGDEGENCEGSIEYTLWIME